MSPAPRYTCWWCKMMFWPLQNKSYPFQLAIKTHQEQQETTITLLNKSAMLMLCMPGSAWDAGCWWPARGVYSSLNQQGIHAIIFYFIFLSRAVCEKGALKVSFTLSVVLGLMIFLQCIVVYSLQHLYAVLLQFCKRMYLIK